MNILIDLIIIALLGFFIWQGWRQGLVASLLGFLAIFIAIFGAKLVADALSPNFSDRFEPFATELVENAFSDKQASGLLQEEIDPEGAYAQSLEGYKTLGLFPSLAERLSGTVQEQIDGLGMKLKDAMIQALCNWISYAVVFLIAFVILFAAMKIVIKIIDIAFKLPGLHLLNTLGGGVIGLLKGLFAIFLIAWLAQFIGVLSVGDGQLAAAFDNTVVLKMFMNIHLF